MAQSQAAACNCSDADAMVDGKDFVRFWVHNGFVNIKEEKMCATILLYFTYLPRTYAAHGYDMVDVKICSVFAAMGADIVVQVKITWQLCDNS